MLFGGVTLYGENVLSGVQNLGVSLEKGSAAGKIDATVTWDPPEYGVVDHYLIRYSGDNTDWQNYTDGRSSELACGGF